MNGWMDGYDSPRVSARIFTEGKRRDEEEEKEDDEKSLCTPKV